MERETLKVNQIASALAAPGRTEGQAAALFRKLVALGVIDREGVISHAVSGKSPHYLYNPLAPAAAAILFALWGADTRDTTLLRTIWTGLLEKRPDGDSWINHILACVKAYGPDSYLPALVVAIDHDAESGETRKRVEVLDSTKTEQGDPPAGFHTIMSIALHLSPLLHRFVE